MKWLKMLLVPFLALAMVACNPLTGPTKPVDPFEQALKDCGPGCKRITFVYFLYDVDMHPIKGNEGYEGELTVHAFADNGSPVEVFDTSTGAKTMSPYTAELGIPLTDNQIIDPNIVQISEDFLLTLPAGWTAKCYAYVDAVQVDYHEVNNLENLVIDDPQVIGLPADKTLTCSWTKGINDIVPA